ncbi:MAG: hypothetical protein QG568_506 [Patescibacteria group bacterium]|nr:hypothetical protein [Patescibacteria group bacterium]
MKKYEDGWYNVWHINYIHYMNNISFIMKATLGISVLASVLLFSGIISTSSVALAQTSFIGSTGKLTVALSTIPTNNSNITAVENVPVYALTTTARSADVTIVDIDLEVSSAKNGTAENPAVLINRINVWDGTVKQASFPVTSTSFVKDSTNAYHMRLSKLNFLVPKDETKTLKITFSVNPIDEHRTVVIDGYGTASLKALSGRSNNMLATHNINNLVKTHVFRKSETPPTASSTNKYIINTPQASSTLSIGNTVDISWTRPVGAMAKTMVRLHSIPEPKKRVAPVQIYIARNVTTSNYSWTIPSSVRPGAYEIVVGPEGGNGGLRAVATSRFVTVVKGGGTATGTASYSQEQSAEVFANRGTSGNTTSVESKFYMKVDARGGAVKMPSQSDFEIMLTKGSSTSQCTQILSLNRNLTIGSTGSDVVELQNFLESKGFLTMPVGVPKGEFENATKAAVSAYQISKGITPADGNVYPLVRANLNAECDPAATITLITPIVASSVVLSADSYSDIQDGGSRSFTVKGLINTSTVPSGLYTTTLRFKNINSAQEFPAQKYVRVDNPSYSIGVATYTSSQQPTITVNSPTRVGDKPAVVATFPLQVTAVGANILNPRASDFRVAFMKGSTTVAEVEPLVTIVPNNPNGIAEGSISSVTVTAMLTGDQVTSGLYTARLVNVKTANGVIDIVTPYPVSVLLSNRMGAGILSASVGIALRMVFGSVVSLFGY